MRQSLHECHHRLLSDVFDIGSVTPGDGPDCSEQRASRARAGVDASPRPLRWWRDEPDPRAGRFAATLRDAGSPPPSTTFSMDANPWGMILSDRWAKRTPEVGKESSVQPH